MSKSKTKGQRNLVTGCADVKALTQKKNDHKTALEEIKHAKEIYDRDGKSYHEAILAAEKAYKKSEKAKSRFKIAKKLAKKTKKRLERASSNFEDSLSHLIKANNNPVLADFDLETDKK